LLKTFDMSCSKQQPKRKEQLIQKKKKKFSLFKTKSITKHKKKKKLKQKKKKKSSLFKTQGITRHQNKHIPPFLIIIKNEFFRQLPLNQITS